MESFWYFADILNPVRCESAPTDPSGMTMCTVPFTGLATPGRTVPVRVRFSYRGQAYAVNTSVTPR